MTKYYAAQVITGQEMKIKQIFDKYLRSQLFKQEVEIVVLQQKVRVKCKKSFINVRKVVMKGYVIIACCNFNNDLYYKLKSIQGIKKILCENIPAEQLEILLNKVKSYYYKRLEIVKKIMQHKSQQNLTFKNIFRDSKAIQVKPERKGGLLFLHRLIVLRI